LPKIETLQINQKTIRTGDLAKMGQLNMLTDTEYTIDVLDDITAEQTWDGGYQMTNLLYQIARKGNYHHALGRYVTLLRPTEMVVVGTVSPARQACIYSRSGSCLPVRRLSRTGEESAC
jgi:hypothetical protein